MFPNQSYANIISLCPWNPQQLQQPPTLLPNMDSTPFLKQFSQLLLQSLLDESSLYPSSFPPAHPELLAMVPNLLPNTSLPPDLPMNCCNQVTQHQAQSSSGACHCGLQKAYYFIEIRQMDLKISSSIDSNENADTIRQAYNNATWKHDFMHGSQLQ